MNYTFNELTEMWLKTKTAIKTQSVFNYQNMISNYINKDLGHIKISDLKKEDIENLFKNFKKKGMAISTQIKLMYIIKATINYAYDNGYINKYLNLKEIKFKNRKVPIFILSKEQQMTLERKLTTNLNIRKICLLLCLYTGLRLGEISGLKWSDIDFNNNCLTVKRTIERIKNSNINAIKKTILIASSPKSNTSNRTVPIPDFLIQYLLKFKGDDKNYLLSKSEKMYDPRLFQRFYHRLLNSCGISKNKFHTTRHTFSTRAIESKMDVKTLSELLGHASIEITLKLYVHPSYELKKSSIENLVNFMSKKNN